MLGKIVFSAKGISEAVRHSCGIDKLKLVPYLRDVIETGAAEQWQDLVHKRNDGLIQFCNIKNTVYLSGKKEDVRVIVGKHRNGNFYYDMFLIKPNKQQTQDKKPTVVTRIESRGDGGHATVAEKNYTNPVTKSIYFLMMS